MLEHRARDHLPELLAGQAEAGHQPVQRGREHVLVGRGDVAATGASKRDPVTADDGDLASLGHEQKLTRE